MNRFLSCDWGTTSFRLRLAEVPGHDILAEEKSATGISRTFALWQQTGEEDDGKRFVFYRQVIQEHIERLERRLPESLEGLPVIISGMASSSIGMMSLPYQELPFAVTGAGLQTQLWAACANFKHDILLVSGIRSEEDVMRGEETQLIGCISGQEQVPGDNTCIFPGTHSKHIRVKDGQVVAFKTYMTGEIFDLLAQKSILQASVDGAGKAFSPTSFRLGVQEALRGNLLYAAFRVRTNQLFGKLTPPENFNFLSGLVIGTELKDLLTTGHPRISLFGGFPLKEYYEAALQELGLWERVTTFPDKWVDEAVVRGQFNIFNQFKNQS